MSTQNTKDIEMLNQKFSNLKMTEQKEKPKLKKVEISYINQVI